MEGPDTEGPDTESRENRPARQSLPWAKVLLVVSLVAGGFALYYWFGDQWSLDNLASHESSLRSFQTEHPVLVYLLAFLIYAGVTGLSLPGATAMTLAFSWYFGLWPAFFLVSFASTTGATIAFLLSRYLFREPIQRRFEDRLSSFNAALEREGAFYLFTLRLIPAVPFFVINVVMGLTPIRTTTFWWVSQIGMLAGTFVYVYAGSTIPSLSHLANPAQIRVADVVDWDRMEQLLRVDASAAAEPMVAVAGRLPEEIRSQLRQPGATTDPAVKLSVVQEINQILTLPELSLRESWGDVLDPDAAQNAARRRELERELTKLNRRLLVTAYPDVLSPPRPIMSKQLILASVVLGLFPWLAKRLLARFRGKIT